MEWIKKGKVWKFDVDHLVPDTTIGWKVEMDGWNSDALAKIFMVKIDPEIPQKVQKGDIIVAGRNFGYGRAHSAFWGSLQAVGIAGIIAESFATPFFKRAIDLGLPILECPDISKKVDQGDELEVNFQTGHIKNCTTDKSTKTEPLPDFQRQIIELGGFKAYLKKKMEH